MDPKLIPLEDLRPVQTWHRPLLKNRAAVVSLLFVAVTLLIALAGPYAYQNILPGSDAKLRDGVYQDYNAINSSPNLTHWLGTDYLGRDTLTRLLTAIRISLLVACLVEAINIGLGSSLGLLAGFFGGWVDIVISRLADMLFAFPGLLLAILVSAVFGSTARELYGGTGRLVLVAGALSLVSWPLMARLVRSETLSIRERDFVTAARGLGAGQLQIILTHLLPNVTWLIIVASTLDVASVIVSEATLSLLGLGIEEPGASLGLMIFRSVGRIERDPFQVFVPALAITGLVLAFSFLGDGLRDIFDPQGR